MKSLTYIDNLEYHYGKINISLSEKFIDNVSYYHKHVTKLKRNQKLHIPSNLQTSDGKKTIEVLDLALGIICLTDLDLVKQILFELPSVIKKSTPIKEFLWMLTLQLIKFYMHPAEFSGLQGHFKLTRYPNARIYSFENKPKGSHLDFKILEFWADLVYQISILMYHIRTKNVKNIP